MLKSFNYNYLLQHVLFLLTGIYLIMVNKHIIFRSTVAATLELEEGTDSESCLQISNTDCTKMK